MKRLFVLAVFVLACASCDSRSENAVSENTRDAVVASIASDQIRRHYGFLADDALQGRMTGQPGYDTAAAYVADFFAEIGLVHGGVDGWYQPVRFQSYLLDTDNARVVMHRNGKEVELGYRDDFGMSADKLREEKSVRADVVYLGYGVHAPELGYSDYDGIDVSGKILAVFSGGPSLLDSDQLAYFASANVKSKEAYSRGAVGFITLRSRKAEKSYPWSKRKASMGKRPGMTWLRESVDARNFWPEGLGSIYLSVPAATELFAAAPLSFKEARDLAEADTVASTPLGLEISIQTYTDFEELNSSNVIGIVRGTDPVLADEYVVYTAHLDHLGIETKGKDDSIYNGAYDNAMGVALMMEAARAVAASPPKRSVMFLAVTGEEHGLLGSDYFVNYPTVALKSIVANINLDMPLFLFPVADVVAIGAEHSSLKAAAERASEAEGFNLVPDPIPEEGLFRRSDQFSFIQAGIPAIYLISAYTSPDPSIDGKALFDEHLKSHYHKPSDDLSRPVHWESAERFARVNARIGFAVADANSRPVWNPNNFFGEKFGDALTRVQ